MEADGAACTARYGVRSAYSDAVGDLAQLADPVVAAKWGPSIGLTQIRSLRFPDIWGPLDIWRVADKLRDPYYNASAAFAISKKGTVFSPWTMYRNGMYQAHAGQDFEVRTGHPRAGEWSK